MPCRDWEISDIAITRLRRAIGRHVPAVLVLLACLAGPALATDAAVFVGQAGVPSAMLAGSTALVSITMQNTGDSTWSEAGLFRLGTQAPQDNSTWLGTNRVGLGLDTVVPGDPYTFTFTITAPATPGTYVFQWRMVHDTVTWFGDFTTSTSITVYADKTWSGTGTWNTGANWTPAGVPTAGDRVIFDATSTANCTVDVVPAMSGIRVEATYTGTIIQTSGVTIATGGYGWSMAGGTFTGSDAAVTFGGPFVLSGGVFTAPAATIASQGDWTKTGGTFTAGTGTAAFTGGAGVTQSLASGGSAFNNLIFSGAGTLRPAADALVIAGDLTMSAGAGTFDNATNDRAVTVLDDLVMDNAATSLGDATWTISGDLDVQDVATLTRNLSTIVLDGTGTLQSNVGARGFYFLTISGTITVREFVTADRMTVTGTCTIGDVGSRGAFDAMRITDVRIPAGGRLTGPGELGSFGGSIGPLDGILDNAYLRIVGDHPGNLIAGRYDCALVDFASNLPIPTATTFAIGTYTFGGDVRFACDSTGANTMDAATNNPVFVFEGSVEIENPGGGALNWLKGTGSMTFSGAGAATQTIDLGAKSVEALVINDSGAVKKLLGGFSASALTVTAGTLDLAGQDIGLVASGAVSNDGVIRLQGDETLTNISGLDANSGTVVYTGRGLSETLTIADFGGTDYNDLVINDGLIGYWPLDETAIGAVVDRSGYGSNGVHSGIGGGFGPSADVPALRFTDARSLDLDGSDDIVRVATGAGSVLDVANGGTLSIAAWIKPASVSGFCTLVIKGRTESLDTANYCMRLHDGRLEFYFRQSDNSAWHECETIAAPVTIGSWQHVAVTATLGTATSLRLYVDGVLYANSWTNGTGNAAPLVSAEELRIGAVFANAERYSGRIDDVRIYRRILSAVEISALAIGNQATGGATTFALGADLALAGDLTLNGGTVDVGVANRAVSIGGAWRNHGAVVNARAGTVTLAGATGGDLLSGAQRFHDLTVAGAGTWTMRDRLRVDDALTIGTGTLDVSSELWTLHAGGIAHASGTLNPRGGTATIVIDGAASGSVATSATLNRVRLDTGLDAGLVGYWKLDDATGAAARDSSGSGNHGTLVGVRWSGAIPGGTAFDNAACGEFDGASTAITATRPLNQVDDWTLAAWVKPTVLPQYNGMVVHVGDDAGGFGISVGGNDNSNPRVFGLYGSVTWIDSGTAIAVAGIWHHVALRRQAGSTSIWVDGVQTAAATNQAPNAPSAAFAIGHQPAYGGRYFQGGIDDVRVYNRPLGDGEIRNLANGRYADGATATPTTTLGANLAVDSLTLDSGVFDTAASTMAVNDAFTLAQGDGAWLGGSATQSFAGGFAISGSTFTGSTGAVDVNGAFAQVATIDSAGGAAQSGGTFIAPSSTLQVSGTFTHGAGTFTHNGGEVVLDGADQTIAGTATTFFDLTKIVASAATLTFPAGASSTQTVVGTCTLQGAVGQRLSLRSATPGSAWYLTPSGPRTISAVDVKDGINTLDPFINPAQSVNSGDNVRWFGRRDSRAHAGGAAGYPHIF